MPDQRMHLLTHPDSKISICGVARVGTGMKLTQFFVYVTCLRCLDLTLNQIMRQMKDVRGAPETE